MNILTFDIEEWFHSDMNYRDRDWGSYEVRIHESCDRILELLNDLGQRGTFFSLGWIARNYPEVIKKITREGHEIGCHSDMHDLAYNLTRDQFKQDTERAIKSIEDVTGNKVTLYRAPAFSISEKNVWALEILAQQGIETDSSIFPAESGYEGFRSFGSSEPALINFKGYELREFPMNTIRIGSRKMVFSGGGYFRLFPYALIRSFTRKSDYVMTYFHPRDFDVDQPRLSHFPLSQKFRIYVGLKGAFSKLERMLKEFDFMTIGEASEQVNWESVKRVSL